jgi:translation initiation factor 6
MHLKAMSIQGDSNLGLHVYANNKYVLVGKNFPDEELKDMEEIFGVPVHKVSIAGTNLIGVFLSGNNEKLLVPSIAFPQELAELKKLGLDYEVIDTQLTCLGNNMVLNDEVGIFHPDFEEKEVEHIKELLGLKIVKQMMIGDTETVGSSLIINNKGGLVHRFAEESEIDLLSELFGIEIHIGTVNLGSPLVSTGIVCNDKGFIIGKISGGPEMTNADEALGFLE